MLYFPGGIHVEPTSHGLSREKAFNTLPGWIINFLSNSFLSERAKSLFCINKLWVSWSFNRWNSSSSSVDSAAVAYNTTTGLCVLCTCVGCFSRRFVFVFIYTSRVYVSLHWVDLTFSEPGGLHHKPIRTFISPCLLCWKGLTPDLLTKKDRRRLFNYSLVGHWTHTL